jgi:hypothetical protein
MTAYQLRNGKPQLGYRGTGPTPDDYEAMHLYLMWKRWIRDERRIEK